MQLDTHTHTHTCARINYIYEERRLVDSRNAFHSTFDSEEPARTRRRGGGDDDDEEEEEDDISRGKLADISEEFPGPRRTVIDSA